MAAAVAQETSFDPYEFDGLVWSQIRRWHLGRINRTQDCSHLETEDLHQTAMLALWERHEEFDGVTDREERGLKAMRIANAGIEKMLTANKLVRTQKALEVVPIIGLSEVGEAEGDLNTLDIAYDCHEDFAAEVEWNTAFEVLKERSQQTIWLRVLGYQWGEIARFHGRSATTVKYDLWRDLDRHDLLDHFPEDEQPGVSREVQYRGEVRRRDAMRSVETARAEDVRYCEECSAPYVRKTTVARSAFEKRRFCSISCARQNQEAHRDQEEARRDKWVADYATRLEEDWRWCNACQTSKPPTEFHANASKPNGRQSQCRDCAAAKYERRKLEAQEQEFEITDEDRKCCLVCEGEFVRRIPFESMQRFLKRRFCRHECYWEWMANPVNDALPTDLISDGQLPS